MNKNKKVILFGAGGAGNNFLKNNTEYDVIAITDNNSDMWSTTLSEHIVISPEGILFLDYDYIVVTSTWADSIQEQLIHKLGVSPSKIIIPKKSAIKSSQHPFQHEPTLELAREVTISVSKYLTSRGVKVYVDFGTLLGFIRDGDIIPWDDDVDFAINEEDFDRTSELMRDFIFFAPKREGVVWRVSIINQGGEDVSISVEFSIASGCSYENFNVGLAKRRVNGDNSEVVGLSGMLYSPSTHFIKNETITVFEHIFVIPDKPEEYLDFVYGDWRTPREGMTFQDYRNRKLISNININSIKYTKRILA